MYEKLWTEYQECFV
jgi:hypothetical protein